MNMKTVVLLCVLLTFFNFRGEAQTRSKVSTVVIDAGHGGADPGCLGKKSKEKEINLKVALKLGKLISDNYDDVRVVYTRKTDVAVELYKRAQIANDNHADLFISVHCNSAENKNARGVETFVMGLHKSEANLAVAKKENAAILKEKNYENNYEGFDPNSPEAGVIFSLYTSAYLKNSALLASKVQRNLVQNTKMTDRKVQQAGFWVLYKVAMPSILVELGFLSNTEEENYMIKSESQDIMALSLYNAFVEYRNQLDGTNKPLLSVTAVTKEKSPEEEVAAAKEQDSDASQAADYLAGVSYRIQFLASPDDVPVNHKRFESLKKVKKYKENNLWKYTCGDESTFEGAQLLLKEVRKSHPDAFIISFLKDEKIPLSEARKLTKK